MSLLQQQGEREEITVINHPERVWTPEVELEIAVCTLSILWELLSSRLQIKVILNHSARHWGGEEHSSLLFSNAGQSGSCRFAINYQQNLAPGSILTGLAGRLSLQQGAVAKRK